MSDAISLAQVEAAQQIVYQHMRPTPLIHYPLLSQEMGFQAYVKHENHTPIGAFKIRGGLNLMAHLARQGVPGVITATRGNHGQSVALAARFYHIPATSWCRWAITPRRMPSCEPREPNLSNTAEILTRRACWWKHYSMSAACVTCIQPT